MQTKTMNVYQAPKSNLAAGQVESSKKFSVWKRFYISFLWSISIFAVFFSVLMVVLEGPKESYFAASVGAVIISLLAGMIGILIPIHRKRVFVTVSVVIAFAAPAIIGSYLGFSHGT